MTLFEELDWRGFVAQTTLASPKLIDKQPYTFYWGVDPSSDSMTVGNLATAMMVKLFIKYGHQPVLLVGGATGMIGDPDGKSEERQLLTKADIKANKDAIAKQYHRLFKGEKVKIVDNFDWFKNFKYLDFLREIGKHVPMRQMLGREFVQTRLSESGSGISYAEFSYVLIQAYDFYFLSKNHGVNMQLCGSDQWGNSIAGVDLIRRLSGKTAEVWSAPLIVNPQTGQKFGKTEEGAIWLDPNKTSPTAFYQFWVNTDDQAVGSFLKIFTELDKAQIAAIMDAHLKEPKKRIAQFKLADAVTSLVHGKASSEQAKAVTEIITGQRSLDTLTKAEVNFLKAEIPVVKVSAGEEVASALVKSGLVSSNTQARQLLSSGAIYVNHLKFSSERFSKEDFTNNCLLLRRGKAYKDSALIELA